LVEKKRIVFSSDPQEIEMVNLIYFLHGAHVMIDSDLAKLLGVDLKRIIGVAAVKHRNKVPVECMFRLTGKESLYLETEIISSHLGRYDDDNAFSHYAFTLSGIETLFMLLKTEDKDHVIVDIANAFDRVGVYRNMCGPYLQLSNIYIERIMDIIKNSIAEK
jgi:hypothetical protein